MNINRNNYEEIFLLYTDNELSAADRRAVEAFVLSNPDLKKELEIFQEYKLSPDHELVFENKESLLKTAVTPGSIDISNYESFFVLYADDELNNEEKAGVENFVYHHPQFQESLELIQQARLTADTSVVCPDKESLYKKEDDDKVVPFHWWRMAVAAVVLLLAGLLWLNREKTVIKPTIAVNTNKNTNRDSVSAKKIPLEITDPGKVRGAQEQIAISTDRKDVQQSDRIKNINESKHNKQLLSKSAEHAIKQVRRDINEQLAVNNKDDNLKNSIVAPVGDIDKKVDVTGFTAVAAPKEPIIDQQITIIHPAENDKIKADYASYNEDNVEVMNTIINKKNSLRGFIRKASRFIAKKTERSDENGNRRGLLIGGFEIAVK